MPLRAQATRSEAGWTGAAARYLFILNPAAGRGRAGRLRPALEAALAAAGLTARVAVTEGPGHAAVLAETATRGYDVVVAVGGDGTVQEVVRGLLAGTRPVHLGVLPLGSGNDFVKMIGMPAAPAAAVEALRHGMPRPVDYGVVRWWDDEGAHRSTFANAVGLGYDARVADQVQRYKHLPGVAGYLLAVLRTLPGWEAPEAEVQMVDADGRAHVYRGRLFLMTTANGVCSGGGFYLTPHASAVDHRFDVCLVEGLTLPRVMVLLPRALWGRHLSAPEVHARRVARVEVVPAAPLPLHADGEVLGRRVVRMTAEVVPGGLSVIVPPGGRLR